jgi:hypothetical protein
VNLPVIRRLTLLGVVGFVLAVGAPATASPPALVSGTYTYTDSYFESFRTAGGNVIIGVVASVEYTGTLTGTSIVRGTIIVHPDGSANFHNVEEFTGTVNGVAGTLTLRIAGSNDAMLDVRAKSTIVDSSDELTGVHGTLALAGSVRFPEGPFGTYSGRLG